ncbi:universal stress protein [Nocardia takedensis]
MSTETPIIAGVDGSPGSDVAVAWAARTAALHGTPLHLLHILDATADYGPGMTEPLTATDYTRLEEHGRWVLAEAVKLATEATGDIGTPPIHTEMLPAVTGPTLVDRTEGARMIVVGTRKRGTLRRALLGSVSSVLARRAHCPVAVVKEEMSLDAEVRTRPVIVGIDGTGADAGAVAAAFAEADARGVDLVAVHVWIGPELVEQVRERGTEADHEEDVLLAESLAGHRERHPDVTVIREVVRDRPERYLHERSRDAQLLVVGSRGRGGFASMLFGSTSQALLLGADCPLLIVREAID